MAKDIFKELDEDFFVLLEAGFLAVNNQDEDSALKLFDACSILRPDNNFPKVGYGYIHLCKLELREAVAKFKEVSDKEPSNEMTKTLLGLAQSLIPTETAEGEKVLEDTLKKTYDPDIKNLADMSLNFVENFVKKSPSPVEVQERKKRAKERAKEENK